jgi:hypothetical protein
METKSGKTEILYGKYRMAPSLHATDRFDLFKTEERRIKTNQQAIKHNKKIGEISGESEGDLAYGMTLEQCLSHVISDVVADKGLSLDLAGYLSEYKKEKAALLDAVNEIVDVKLKNK